MRCDIWLKHSECSEADRYGKNMEGRNSNSEHPKRRKKKQKGTKKEEKKFKTVQMIQNMVLGSIKCESVSLFTIIQSDVKLQINFLKTTFA
jgi:5'-3' exonuclease